MCDLASQNPGAGSGGAPATAAPGGFAAGAPSAQVFADSRPPGKRVRLSAMDSPITGAPPSPSPASCEPTIRNPVTGAPPSPNPVTGAPPSPNPGASSCMPAVAPARGADQCCDLSLRPRSPALRRDSCSTLLGGTPHVGRGWGGPVNGGVPAEATATVNGGGPAEATATVSARNERETMAASSPPLPGILIVRCGRAGGRAGGAAGASRSALEAGPPKLGAMVAVSAHACQGAAMSEGLRRAVGQLLPGAPVPWWP
jgi:hypothetical protein